MPTVAVLATLDTKEPEVTFLADELRALGATPLRIDVGVLGAPTTVAEVSRQEVAEAGGSSLSELLRHPTRQTAAPVMIAGAVKILRQRLDRQQLDAVIGLGGTQGTSTCCQVMQTLPYGLPKIMVSTVASGDTSAFVDIKDITMMFSVCDLLGLNPLTRKILANAAGAAWGMCQTCASSTEGTATAGQADKPVIGMTNLGVLTEGATRAVELFQKAGYEVMVFHAVGSGGRAMEQMMKEGLIGAVFDYALGEISDEVFGGLRAGGPHRLTVAGTLGLPQLLCPGGAEHIGLTVSPPNVVPDRYRDHQHVFHSPLILAPRLKPDELTLVAEEICQRLQATHGRACLMYPRHGTSRYAVAGGELHDPQGDLVFLDTFRECLPPAVKLVECDAHAEAPAFVDEAVRRLIDIIEQP